MLKPLGDDIWVVEHDLYTFGIHFPGRMTVIRLSSGQLWLCSVVPIDDALAAQLAELGPVSHIVAPNRFHHLYLVGAIERYPDAKVYASPGLSEKRKDIDFIAELGTEAPEAWSADIEQLSLAAIPLMGEVVFFHKVSGTLVTTDLFMNVHKVDGWLGWFIYWAEGCWKKPGVPRLNRFMVKDKPQMRADATKIEAWPIQCLVMAHGEIVDDDAAGVVHRSFEVFGTPESVPARV